MLSRLQSLLSKNTVIVVTPPKSDIHQESRVEDYLRKSAVLRQIMSNKGRTYRKINAAQNVATVAVSALLLFIGFSGIPKIQNWVSWVAPIGADAVELSFNLLVFLLFVIGVLHLVFQFSDKQGKADQAVAALAALGNEIEDLITSRGNLVISEDASKISLIRTRYEAIAQSIPSNSDREFLRARRDLAKKEASKPKFYLTPEMIFNKAEQEQAVSAIILGSRTIVDVLIALRNVDRSLFLGGGLVRNAVWDFLHGYRSPTPVDDVDVVYFDDQDIEKRHDEDINRRLESEIPNIHWSTKNQARMHLSNGELPYADLFDAVGKWPETATALAVRLNDDGTLKFVAPHGFDDLLRMVVRITPSFLGREQTVRERINTKRWVKVWPRLLVLVPDPDQK